VAQARFARRAGQEACPTETWQNGDIQPKYSRIEYERRFLVDAEAGWRRGIEPYSKRIEDHYLDCGRLRLRRIEESDGSRVTFKLTKKYESDSRLAQPIVTILLSAAEYEALAGLPGHGLSKTRHYHGVFSVDVFEGALAGLVLCEAEAPDLDALRALEFPAFARWEVTENPDFEGGALCRMTAEEIAAAIAATRI